MVLLNIRTPWRFTLPLSLAESVGSLRSPRRAAGEGSGVRGYGFCNSPEARSWPRGPCDPRPSDLSRVPEPYRKAWSQLSPVIEKNIERNRKRDALLEVVDAQGRRSRGQALRAAADSRVPLRLQPVCPRLLDTPSATASTRRLRPAVQLRHAAVLLARPGAGAGQAAFCRRVAADLRRPPPECWSRGARPAASCPRATP